MKLEIVAIFTALLILSGTAEAMEIKSYSIVSEITNDNTVLQKMMITIQNDGLNELSGGSISTPLDSKIMSITDNYGDLSYTIEENGRSDVVFQLSKPLRSGESRLIIIELETGGLVKKVGDYFEYILVFTPKQNISGFEHFLKLPEDAKLYSPEQFSVVFPEAETGKMNDAVTVKWTSNLAAGEPQVFLARFKKDYVDWNLIGMAITGIAAVLVLGIPLQKALKKYSSRKREDSAVRSLNLLNETEKPVVESVIRNPGMKQSELREMLNYKKSALSKIISRLEARNIIERKKSGKIKRLYPGERLKKPGN